MKPFKAWAVVDEDGGIHQYKDGTLDIYLTEPEAMALRVRSGETVQQVEITPVEKGKKK